MKKVLVSLVFFSMLTFTASAQAPQAFKYQAVVRDAAGQVLVDQTVALKINLIQVDTVYSETHTATTNAFGLVNLEVGRGTVQFGQFNTIEWSLQPTFIQVMLDAAGGSNYESMGFSELLSVPYALYASNAAGGNGLPDDPKTGDLLFFDGTAWQTLPGGPVGTVLTMGADGLPAWKPLSPPTDSLLEVSMTNGNIIYVSPVDNSSGVQWGGIGIDITNVPNFGTLAAAVMDFNGEGNTAAIVAQLGNNNGNAFAAKICADLVAYGFNDWYLPSAGELEEMHDKLGPIAEGGNGQMPTGFYWSSSEFSANSTWARGFDGGGQGTVVDKTSPDMCRCIRR